MHVFCNFKDSLEEMDKEGFGFIANQNDEEDVEDSQGDIRPEMKKSSKGIKKQEKFNINRGKKLSNNMADSSSDGDDFTPGNNGNKALYSEDSNSQRGKYVYEGSDSGNSEYNIVKK